MGVAVSEPSNISDVDIAGSSGDATVKGSNSMEISNECTKIRVLTRATSGKSCEVIPIRNTRSLQEEEKRASDEGSPAVDVRESRCDGDVWWDGPDVRSSDSLEPRLCLGLIAHKHNSSKSKEGTILGVFGSQGEVRETVHTQGETQQSTPGRSPDNMGVVSKESFEGVSRCSAGVYPRTLDIIDPVSLDGNHQVDPRKLGKAFEDEHRSEQDGAAQGRDKMLARDEGWAPFAFKGRTSSLSDGGLPTAGCVDSSSMPQVGGSVLDSRTTIDVVSFSLQTKQYFPMQELN